MSDHDVLCGDCLDLLKQLPDACVDLVFCSPPYEAARTYGIDFSLKGQEWVEWAMPRFLECLRVCKGLVAWVVEGQTKNYRYSAAPVLLMADLHRVGVKLRKPPIYRRNGIPGSGGPDWLRNDYEFVVCASHGRLPWSDNTAMGHPPVRPPGGVPSHRTQNGVRVNASREPASLRFPGRKNQDGIRGEKRGTAPRYKGVTIANPGNTIDCRAVETGHVIDLGAAGGGNMGSKLCHENEAPFPEKLAEFFVRSFCPPGGCVLDIFGGSGTTAAVALQHGRDSISIDIRQNQCDLTRRRLDEVLQAAAAGTGAQT